MNILKGIKKYIVGYYDFGKTIDGMNPCVFVIYGLWCWLRYGCVFNQFTEGRFYKYRGYHRKKFSHIEIGRRLSKRIILMIFTILRIRLTSILSIRHLLAANGCILKQ